MSVRVVGYVDRFNSTWPQSYRVDVDVDSGLIEWRANYYDFRADVERWLVEEQIPFLTSFTRTNTMLVYFKTENDAMRFRLRWG